MVFCPKLRGRIPRGCRVNEIRWVTLSSCRASFRASQDLFSLSPWLSGAVIFMLMVRLWLPYDCPGAVRTSVSYSKASSKELTGPEGESITQLASWAFLAGVMQAEYGTYPVVVSPEYRRNFLKPLNDRFCLAEACLLADVVQYLEDFAGSRAYHPRSVWFEFVGELWSRMMYLGLNSCCNRKYIKIRRVAS